MFSFFFSVPRRTQKDLGGYLFVCPTAHVQTGPTKFRRPDCPAYWSLDPSGDGRLSTEEATLLGFPSLNLTTAFTVYSWDSSVYAGLRKFHEGKGFDPDSQEVARHCGHRLFQLTSEREVLFAHGSLNILSTASYSQAKWMRIFVTQKMKQKMVTR